MIPNARFPMHVLAVSVWGLCKLTGPSTYKNMSLYRFTLSFRSSGIDPNLYRLYCKLTKIFTPAALASSLWVN
jgi:hypothetical protein